MATWLRQQIALTTDHERQAEDAEIERDLYPVRAQRAEPRLQFTGPTDGSGGKEGSDGAGPEQPSFAGTGDGAGRPVPKTSTRTVQAVLFVLGGVLLGTAAIALAWPIFGPAAAVLVAALVLVGGSVVSGSATLRRISGGATVVALAVAGGFVLVTAQPDHGLLLVAALTAVLSLLTVLISPIVPARVRPGPRGGALLVAGGVTLAVGAVAATAASATMSAALPMWTAALTPTGPRPPAGTWELPLAGLLVGVALAAAGHPRSRVTLAGVGAVLVVLALPGSVALLWWAPAPIALAAAALALAASLAGRTERATYGAAACAAVLLTFAVATSLIRPGLTAAVLGGVSLIGTGAAVAASRRPHGGADRLAVGGAALTLALLSLPPAIGCLLVAAGAPPWWAARAIVISLTAVVALVALAARSRMSTLDNHVGWYAFAGAAVGAVAWPAVAASVGHEPRAVYAAVSVLTVAGAYAALPREVRTVIHTTTAQDGHGGHAAAGRTGGQAALSAALPGLAALAITVAIPLLTVVGGPYAWLGSIWSGRPDGVGLYPPGAPLSTSVAATDAVALAVFALACAVATFAVTGRIRAGSGALAIGGTSAVILGVTATGAPWPAVPAITLLIGLSMLLIAARSRPDSPRTAITTFLGAVYSGAGLAGALSVRWSTLTALGLVLIVTAVIGVVSRTRPWRLAGWLAAAVTAAATIAAATIAAATIAAATIAAATIAAASGFASGLA